MKNFTSIAFGFMIGCIVCGITAQAALVNRISPPSAVVIHEIVRHDTPKPVALDSVIRLYGPDGHPTREYTGNFTGIEQTPGAVKFKLENGRTVILGGSFSVEEIPHQEP